MELGRGRRGREGEGERQRRERKKRGGYKIIGNHIIRGISLLDEVRVQLGKSLVHYLLHLVVKRMAVTHATRSL